MRMRKKKNGAARLEKCKQFLAVMPEKPIKNTERDFDRRVPLWLEIGAGKGGFALGMTARHPEIAYYAMERVSDCVVLAAESLSAVSGEHPDNLRFIVGNADDLGAWFAPGAVDAIFLNFSDPWPKKGYAKRRLTYRAYLSLYFTLLRDGGTWQFKTDNTGLFDFTREELTALGLSPVIEERDLHASPYDADNIRTEYESAFAAQGVPICMLRVIKPAGYQPPAFPLARPYRPGMPPEEKPDGEN